MKMEYSLTAVVPATVERVGFAARSEVVEATCCSRAGAAPPSPRRARARTRR